MSHDPDGADLVEMGRADRGGQALGRRLFGERFRLPDGGRPWPGWRPSRGACIFAAAALAVGLAAGYAAGRGGGIRPARVAVQPGPARPSATASPALASPFVFADSPALTQEIGGCSMQVSHLLELGVQVTNQSMVPVTLRSAKAVLPLGGLSPVTWHWSPCGALPQTLADAQGDEILQPGASTWLTMIFGVKLGCPEPLPVQFTIGYLAGGRSATASLPGFADLTQVPYSGCPNSTAASGAQLAQQAYP